MIINKLCRKCGRPFVDASMFGQQHTCDTCSQTVSWSQSNTANKPIPVEKSDVSGQHLCHICGKEPKERKEKDA